MEIVINKDILPRRILRALPVLVALIAVGHGIIPSAIAQESDSQRVEEPPPDTDEDAPTAPEKVEVDPLAQDDEIEKRLTRILEATQRFQQAEVTVDEGVVFLSGTTRKDEFRVWAGDLARNTQDVVAVVNRIEVREGSIWDLSPAWAEIRRMIRELVQALPLIALALVLLFATWLAARLAVYVANIVLERRMSNRLLRQVATRAVAIPVFLLGLYLILRVSGLTQVAATVLGGTGLIGLVVGIAFRDIAENFLASILISLQRPFSIGDLVKVEDHTGFVQSVTTRGTLLMTLDGNHVQIPNSTIYKAIIHNFTANPKLRLNFVVGIGYEDSVAKAQEIAFATLREHPIVLDDPEALVLVEELGAATVNLHIYFWIDGNVHSQLKARSSVIRLVKRAFEKNGISMPDEAREVVFPGGVPIDTSGFEHHGEASRKPADSSAALDDKQQDDEVTNEAEGDMTSEAAEIKQQADRSRLPGDSPNLLEESSTAGGAVRLS